MFEIYETVITWIAYIAYVVICIARCWKSMLNNLRNRTECSSNYKKQAMMFLLTPVALVVTILIGFHIAVKTNESGWYGIALVVSSAAIYVLTRNLEKSNKN